MEILVTPDQFRRLREVAMPFQSAPGGSLDLSDFPNRLREVQQIVGEDALNHAWESGGRISIHVDWSRKP